VKLDEVNLIEYNFIAAGLNRTAIAERFDAEIAPQPTSNAAVVIELLHPSTCLKPAILGKRLK
jgi:hypothetical protein